MTTATYKNSKYLQATEAGLRYSFAALIFGSLGMWLGESLSPIEATTALQTNLSNIIISSMSLFMVVFCVPVCIWISPPECKSYNWNDKCLLHVLGKTAMLLGMALGFKAFPPLLTLCGGGPYHLAHALMITGMTVGTGCGYAIAFLIISNGNENPEHFGHQSCCESKGERYGRCNTYRSSK